ncbi:MAG: alpha/beta hydrolase [Acidobacteria bacterium]|nr:alpha/beta hydrolase [Acidobacteriota bacterium]MDA1235265.1 alpha/beta hydrolase [Acidobacteriota bacterium]
MYHPHTRHRCLVLFAAMFLTAGICAAAEPQVIRLWDGPAPGSPAVPPEETERVTPGGDHVLSNVHVPSITVYLPSEGATGAAVVIAPGGGHSSLWITHEGYNEAAWLAEHGVAAFVLKYRLARMEGSPYKIEEHSLQDAQRAIRMIRARSQEWGVDPNRIGVMGFSAGGEIASLAADRYDAGNSQSSDPIERQSSKPAFQALIYPAIPQLTLNADTPPAFLVCGEKDRQNISEGLPELYLQMKRANVSAELHVFAGVGHGFGLRDRLTGPVSHWLEHFRGWMDASGFLTAGE